MAEEAQKAEAGTPQSGDGAAVAVGIDVKPTGTVEGLAEYLGVPTGEALDVALTKLKDADETRQRMVDLFEKNPTARQILTGAAEKGDFIAGLASALTPEEYAEEVAALTEGSPAFIAKQERLMQLQAKKDREAERNTAFESSQKTYDKWVEDKGLSDNDQALFEEEIKRFAQIFEDGKITPTELDKLWGMYDMDNIISQRVTDAEVAARNEEKSRKRAKRVEQEATPIPDIPEGGGEVAGGLSPELDELNAIVARDSKIRNPFG